MKKIKNLILALALVGNMTQTQAAEHVMTISPKLGLLNLGGLEIMLILLLLMTFIALPVVGVMVIVYFVTRRNGTAGRPPIVTSADVPAQPPVTVPLTKTAELRWGIIFIAAGIGIMGSFAFIFGPNLWALGIIPTCIGGGCLIAGLIRSKA